MNGQCSFILTLSFIWVFTFGGFGQSVPPLINYQGKLTDQNGSPLPAGTYAIQFRIWGSATATNGAVDLIWGQQQNAAIQSNGVFNVILGSPGGSPIAGATPAVNSLAYAFTGSNCFLGVTIVVSNGTAVASPSEILPRQQLLSVPFALTAQSVVPGSINSSSIATGSIQASNLAAGAVTLSQLASRFIATNGVATQVGQVAVGTLTSSFWVGDGGGVNVGIGSDVQVPGLIVTNYTSGRPVLVILQGGVGNSLSAHGTSPGTSIDVEGGGLNYGSLSLYRDGQVIYNVMIAGQSAGLGAIPPFISYLDMTAAPGTHTYSIEMQWTSPEAVSNYVEFNGPASLVVMEL